MKRIMWPNLMLGLWLMLSPLILAFLNRGVVKVLWEDLILGFGIATFSLCRMLSRRSEEIAIADWIVTTLGFSPWPILSCTAISSCPQPLGTMSSLEAWCSSWPCTRIGKIRPAEPETGSEDRARERGSRLPTS
jgi:hypothetical protein